MDRLDTQFQLLTTQPMMGRVRYELTAGMRSVPFGRYVIFYALIDDEIDIVRVLHSARDVDSAFDGPEQ